MEIYDFAQKHKKNYVYLRDVKKNFRSILLHAIFPQLSITKAPAAAATNIANKRRYLLMFFVLTSCNTFSIRHPFLFFFFHIRTLKMLNVSSDVTVIKP
jgi:hypothetical protein